MSCICFGRSSGFLEGLICMSHVTHMDKLHICLGVEGGSVFIGMSHAKHMNETCHPYDYVGQGDFDGSRGV